MINNRLRDTQRSKVYQAGRLAAVAFSGQANKPTIANEDLQAFVDSVYRKRAVKTRWNWQRPPRVVLKRGGRAIAYTFSNYVSLPLFARNEWVMLHEIAHMLTPTAAAVHGPEFAGTYLFLVRTVLGADAGRALQGAYRATGARYTMKTIPESSHRAKVRA
jgi:hypothetical protein